MCVTHVRWKMCREKYAVRCVYQENGENIFDSIRQVRVLDDWTIVQRASAPAGVSKSASDQTSSLVGETEDVWSEARTETLLHPDRWSATSNYFPPVLQQASLPLEETNNEEILQYSFWLLPFKEGGDAEYRPHLSIVESERALEVSGEPAFSVDLDPKSDVG